MNSRKGKHKMSSAKPRDSRPTVGLLSEVGGSSYHNALWAGFAGAAPELNVNLICYVGGLINASEYGFDAQGNILYDLVDAERVDGLIICGVIGNFQVGQRSVKNLAAVCRLKWLPFPPNSRIGQQIVNQRLHARCAVRGIGDELVGVLIEAAFLAPFQKLQITPHHA